MARKPKDTYRFIAEVFKPAHERAKRAAATRRDRELTERQDKRWTEWDYIEEPIDDVGGEDGKTPDFQ